MRLIRFLLRWTLYLLALAVLFVAAGRWVVPPITHTQWVERQRLGALQREWVPFEAAGPLPAAVIAAEDANFCAHWGFDFDAIRAALQEDRRRGASTISQQVAKNVYLWQEQSWLRKGIEAAVTLVIEATWSKRRIVEVYVNVAEMGNGVFGAEAAARHWFGTSAASLSPAQAARIAAILPAPHVRSASAPGDFTAGRARSIAEGARSLRQSDRLACLTPG